VLKCLAKDAAGRYGTAEELAEDLRRFLADRTIRARRAGYWERTWRWCRRNPAVASLLAAVAVLLIAVAVVSAFYAAHQQAAAAHEKAAATDLAGALRDSEAKRWESLRDQARAMRMSRHPGQRVKSLQAIQEAMQLPLPPGHCLVSVSVAEAASTPSCGPLHAASRSTSPSASPWGNPLGWCPTKPAGGSVDTLPGYTR
jgi:hypothetical protein